MQPPVNRVREGYQIALSALAAAIDAIGDTAPQTHDYDNALDYRAAYDDHIERMWRLTRIQYQLENLLTRT